MRYDELGNKLQELENKGSDSALYRIEATIFADVAPGGKFDVVLEKRFPLIRVPEISMAGVEIDKAGLSGATMIVNIRVRNKNAFGFGFKNIAYELAIGENQPVKGDKAEDLYFPARDSTAVSIPFQLDPVEAGKSLIDWIGAGDDLAYQFTLTAEIVSEQHFFRNSKIAMEADGTFGELEKAIRKGTENE